jgi:ABC-2 type transport system ATP-binding protein
VIQKEDNMIQIEHLDKAFDGYKAVDDVSLTIHGAQVFGLVGTNGAGKSTILRLVSGILKPDKGSILVDGKSVYDKPETKKNIFFIMDDPYFFPNSTAVDMKEYYRSVYKDFNVRRFDKLLHDFGLDPRRKVANYSRGMKKQLGVICGISSGVRYLLCDETFDGLDPVMRQAVKSIFAGDMEERGLTPVIASHNLRELEDICDHVGLVHKGGLLLSEDLDAMKLGIQKLQCVFADDVDIRKELAGLDILSEEHRGRLCTYVVRGEREAVAKVFSGIDTLYFEILPLTLEEIFISETEVAGYDIRKYILD